MELRNLMTFVQVAELGNFTKTAELLGYSQSTISFQIKQLEAELGCLLFERINHTVKLTERGHALVSYAHKVLALTEEFRENMSQERTLTGHIHIVTPDSVCEELINTHYMEFHRAYPSISVKFSTADTTDMFEMLDHNEADVIITLDNHSYDKDYTIACEEPLPMHFVARADSHWAGVRGLSIADIVGEPFILTEYGQGYRRVFDRELAKRSLSISPVLEIGRTDIITSVVSQSDMISFLPDFVTKAAVEAGRLTYLDVVDIRVDIWKQLIYHKNKWLSYSLRALIDFIKRNEFAGE